jgi:hypothetical protein
MTTLSRMILELKEKEKKKNASGIEKKRKYSGVHS